MFRSVYSTSPSPHQIQKNTSSEDGRDILYSNCKSTQEHFQSHAHLLKINTYLVYYIYLTWLHPPYGHHSNCSWMCIKLTMRIFDGSQIKKTQEKHNKWEIPSAESSVSFARQTHNETLSFRRCSLYVNAVSGAMTTAPSTQKVHLRAVLCSKSSLSMNLLPISLHTYFDNKTIRVFLLPKN